MCDTWGYPCRRREATEVERPRDIGMCARARKWNGFSRKVERSSQLMERLMAHEFSQNGTALAPIWNDPLSNRDAPVILSQWNGNP